MKAKSEQHRLLTPEYAYLTDVKRRRADGSWKVPAHGQSEIGPEDAGANRSESGSNGAAVVSVTDFTIRGSGRLRLQQPGAADDGAARCAASSITRGAADRVRDVPSSPRPLQLNPGVGGQPQGSVGRDGT